MGVFSPVQQKFEGQKFFSLWQKAFKWSVWGKFYFCTYSRIRLSWIPNFDTQLLAHLQTTLTSFNTLWQLFRNKPEPKTVVGKVLFNPNSGTQKPGLPPLFSSTGQDLYAKVSAVMERLKLPWSELTNVTTNGSPNLKGKNVGTTKRLHNRVKNTELDVIFLDWIIHQKVLCKSILRLDHVVKPVVKLINRLQAKGLNHSQFTKFFEDLDADCQLIYLITLIFKDHNERGHPTFKKSKQMTCK